MKKTTWPGNWKVSCQVCGFWHPSSEIQKRWDGLLVCKKDYETRHPQTMIKVRGETAFPDFVSKDIDTQIQICDFKSSSPYVGLAAVGCAKVGTYYLSYQDTLTYDSNGH